MHRKHTPEITNAGLMKGFYVAPVTACSIRQTSLREKIFTEEIYNYKRMLLKQEAQIRHNQIASQKCGMLGVRVTDLDHQISNIIRQRDMYSITHSQSFTHDPSAHKYTWAHNHSGPLVDSSKSTVYMSPPSPNWTTVGNIMTVKRSTSMPGSKSNSITLVSKPPQTSDNTYRFVKKKNSPFQCLKHQFKKISLKNVSEVNDSQAMNVSVTLPGEATKTSAIKLKKRKMLTTNNVQNCSFKSKGIRKSISMLFFKSNHSTKSNSYFTNEMQTSSKDVPYYTTYQKLCHGSSRSNLSYEYMLDDDDHSKLSCFSDLQESESFTTSNETRSMDTVMPSYSPNKMSLCDSFSLCSNYQLLSSQSTSLYESINYNNNDISWKSVVGNVCRSNSKDSAIANSTLSGDGMMNHSKRISLTSNISKMSDFITATDDFNDSSYSSFNDLEINPSQSSYIKPRLLTNVTKLKPIYIEYITTETPDVSDVSPSSDSSTETLKPMSHLLRRRYLSSKDTRSSHSDIVVSLNNICPTVKGLKGHYLKRFHSWPGCDFHAFNTPLTFISTKPPLPPRLPQKNCISKSSINHISRMDEPFHKGRLNSSPLLSQYSRLYSLRSSLVKDPQSPNSISGQLIDFTQAFMSSTKTYPVLLKPLDL